MSEVTSWDSPAYQSELDFADLIDGASFVAGADVVTKDQLEGIPFVVTRMRFSDGKGKADFVSIEAVTKDNRKIIINDGSTGIRRQAVAFLDAKGFITVGPGDEDGPDSRYDKHSREWAKGSELAASGFDVKLVATRGLRGSTYMYQGEPVTTYYMA